MDKNEKIESADKPQKMGRHPKSLPDAMLDVVEAQADRVGMSRKEKAEVFPGRIRTTRTGIPIKGVNEFEVKRDVPYEMKEGRLGKYPVQKVDDSIKKKEF